MAQGRVIAALLLIGAVAYAATAVATAADVAAATESNQVVSTTNMRKLLVKITGETQFWTGGEEVWPTLAHCWVELQFRPLCYSFIKSACEEPAGCGFLSYELEAP
jgi:hypothetical protein